MSNLIPLLEVDATRTNPAIRLAKGMYQKWRRIIAGSMIAVFILAPWLEVNGAPLLWMDLQNRELHLVGLTLWPDDLLILIWIAMASAFALFTVATISGRLWCGFACPQSVWSMMFTWVEEKTQGSRNKRLKENDLPILKRRLMPLFAKHFLWGILAFITAFTFVAFFETGASLGMALVNFQLDGELTFWLVFFSVLTYINAGWLREQVCNHMCPYARFQSVMLDEKSLKVTYNEERGEPKKGSGDCVDCELCVQVCPVGIDIRQGLQYACIDCGACIDACDDIMKKVNKPTGLINFSYPGFSNANASSSNFSKENLKDLLIGRGKLWGYALCTLLAGAALLLQLSFLETLDAHLSRDRGQLYFYTSQGQLANGYTLKIHNKTTQTKQYNIKSITPDISLEKPLSIALSAGDDRTVAFKVQCSDPCKLAGTYNVDISVESHDKLDQETLTSRFFAPR
jgi:cytochrome c oxidase accessory protein FixG